MSVTQFVTKYFELSDTHRELVRYFYIAEIKRKKGQYTDVYPRIKTLAKFARCSDRTVIRFNKLAFPNLFIITTRLRENKSQASNKYLMVPKFFEALAYLDKNNLLYENPKKLPAILKRMQTSIHVTPPSQEEMSPLYSETYSETKYPRVHYKINQIKISQDQKIALSRFAEHAIEKGIEDCLWYTKRGNIVRSPFGLLYSRIKSHAQRA